MPLYTCLHNLLNVLVQIANKMGLQKKRLWNEDSTGLEVSYCTFRILLVYYEMYELIQRAYNLRYIYNKAHN
jgi:hypothetical protein